MRNDRVYMRDQVTNEVDEIMDYYKNKPNETIFHVLFSFFTNIININRRRDNR
jgi:hypothetical protein